MLGSTTKLILLRNVPGALPGDLNERILTSVPFLSFTTAAPPSTRGMNSSPLSA